MVWLTEQCFERAIGVQPRHREVVTRRGRLPGEDEELAGLTGAAKSTGFLKSEFTTESQRNPFELVLDFSVSLW